MLSSSLKAVDDTVELEVLEIRSGDGGGGEATTEEDDLRACQSAAPSRKKKFRKMGRRKSKTQSCGSLSSLTSLRGAAEESMRHISESDVNYSPEPGVVKFAGRIVTRDEREKSGNSRNTQSATSTLSAEPPPPGRLRTSVISVLGKLGVIRRSSKSAHSGGERRSAPERPSLVSSYFRPFLFTGT
ncbi:uncharacterized protein LOC129794055 [Lutzomyia longipalpis]|uniref:uncharacterized protein LOC129794055 n=1 Tax=Lutzomyia longipalpis TaxID=7200 RepID=UPI00248390F8|nr:uncharacterized protein LOC129794055 [Lutzomyia longipalpis]